MFLAVEQTERRRVSRVLKASYKDSLIVFERKVSNLYRLAVPQFKFSNFSVGWVPSFKISPPHNDKPKHPQEINLLPLPYSPMMGAGPSAVLAVAVRSIFAYGGCDAGVVIDTAVVAL